MTIATRRSGDEDAAGKAPRKASAPGEDEDPQIGKSSVAIVNETDLPIGEELIRRAIVKALDLPPCRSAEVSVAVVDDAAIHRLNAQFLNHDYPTDVLSFLLLDEADKLEGELVVSAETAVRCAAEAGWNASDELLLYVVHGALHLAGFDDATSSDAAAMRHAEAQVLHAIGVALSPADERWRAADPLIESSSQRGMM